MKALTVVETTWGFFFSGSAFDWPSTTVGVWPVAHSEDGSVPPAECEEKRQTAFGNSHSAVR